MSVKLTLHFFRNILNQNKNYLEDVLVHYCFLPPLEESRGIEARFSNKCFSVWFEILQQHLTSLKNLKISISRLREIVYVWNPSPRGSDQSQPAPPSIPLGCRTSATTLAQLCPHVLVGTGARRWHPTVLRRWTLGLAHTGQHQRLQKQTPCSLTSLSRIPLWLWFP